MQTCSQKRRQPSKCVTYASFSHFADFSTNSQTDVGNVCLQNQGFIASVR